jgi:hypothetical protein
MDWSPSYYILWTLAAGAILVGLIIVAAKIRMRPLWFVTIGMAAVALGIFYIMRHDPRRVAEASSSTGIRSKQVGGESTVGRNEPAGHQSEDSRAPSITKSETPVARISDDQRAMIRDYLAQHTEANVDKVDFSLVIGAAVPRQARLSELPVALSDLLNGFKGDQYVLVRDQLVIVDFQSRRIVAIFPGLA